MTPPSRNNSKRCVKIIIGKVFKDRENMKLTHNPLGGIILIPRRMLPVVVINCYGAS